MTESMAETKLESGATVAPRRRGLYAECLKSYLRVVAALPQDSMLDRVLLRTASRRAIDLLALWVTDGRLRYQQVLAHVMDPGSNWDSLCVLAGKRVNPGHIVRLARIVALQSLEPDDHLNGLLMLRWVWQQCGRDSFNPDQARLFQNLAFEQAEFQLAARLVEDLTFRKTAKAVMRADLSNPWGPSPYGSETDWQREFGRIFSSQALEEPCVLPGPAAGREPFDRLSCSAEAVVDEGPLVSVIVTSWCPGEGLETAVHSLLNQSWRNLEILLVDDASPDEYQPLLSRISAMDARIRLIRLRENGGTYLARNAALRAARGDFVTGQDSDDWSHPRRIEIQARELQHNTSFISTTSHALRCDPLMVFNYPGTLARRENASSLMFRRQPVIENVGYYDATRKGGDTEFMLRMQRVFGDRSHRMLEQNLALIRLSRDSLSNKEFKPGWRHPARSSYRRSYEYWHSVEVDPARLRMDEALGERRRFPLPKRFAIHTDDPNSARAPYDVVFVDDLRATGSLRHLRNLMDEVHCALAGGMKVGLAHLRSFRDISFERIDTFWEPFARLVQDEVVDEILLSDAVRVRTLLVRRPEPALFMNPAGIELKAERVVLVADQRVRNPSGRVWYTPVACQRNLRDAFAAPVEWAADGAVAADLAESLPPGSRIGAPYPVAIDVRRWRAPARRIQSRHPIIGRIADDLPDDFPSSREELLAAYPHTGRMPVRILGGETACRRVLGDRPVPGSWTFFRSEDTEPGAFLSRCDFFVYFDRGRKTRAPERLIAQALASGCVVVTSVAYAKRYKGAVVGVAPEGVRSIVERFSANLEEFRDQVERGHSYVRQHHGFEGPFLERLGLEGKTVGPATSTPSAPREATARDLFALPVPQVVRDHAATYEARGFLREIDRTILRTGSIQARDILASMASVGVLTWQQIQSCLSAYRLGREKAAATRVFHSLEPKIARRLARVVALQALLPDDRINALTIYKGLLEVRGIACLDLHHGKLAADLAFYLRDWAFLEYALHNLRLKEVDRQFLEADMVNPFIGSPYADMDRWLELFNRGFVRAGVEPILFQDDMEAGNDRPQPFDRVTTKPLERRMDGELVSVVITSWRPDEGLVSAVRSITRQTWGNLEILLIDDASPPEFVPLLQRVAASDPRIRLIRQPSNGGTYVARNRGLQEATGKYFTVHDSDDWAHPQRIELQVKVLRQDESLVSSGSFAYRCDDNLVVNFPGVMPDRENASSLLFDLERVKGRIGYFDTSRKGADTEFALRMRMAFGAQAHRVLPQPLALIRLSPGSLSRAEFKPGWRHPARAFYRRSYEAWHRKVKESGGGYVGFPLEGRPFPLPARFIVDRAGAETAHHVRYDVVFVADLRASAGLEWMVRREIEAASARGLKVGVLHLESYWNASPKEIEPFHSEIEEMLQQGVVDEVLYTDGASIGTLIVRDPSVLQFSLPGASALEVGRTVIVSTRGYRIRNGRVVYDPADCARNGFRMFGKEPEWMATCEVEASALASAVSHRVLSPKLWSLDLPEAAGAVSDRDFVTK